jgi:hypothetical protein
MRIVNKPKTNFGLPTGPALLWGQPLRRGIDVLKDKWYRLKVEGAVVIFHDDAGDFRHWGKNHFKNLTFFIGDPNEN